MLTSRRLFGIFGTAAVMGGFLYLTSAFTTNQSVHSQEKIAAVIKRQPQVSAAEERSLRFHTAGIRKALEGDYPNAIVDYDQALLLSPHNSEIYYNRAVAHYWVGKSRLALQDLDQAVQLQPSMAEGYANRGSIRLETGDVAGALSDARKAAKLFEQQGEPELAEEMQDWVRYQTAKNRTANKS